MTQNKMNEIAGIQAPVNGLAAKGAAVIALVGFEESQAVTIALREQGVEAYSCDLQDCSGGHPEWHLKMDIFKAIMSRKWDLIILHPPCTYTALCGNRWYYNSPLRIEGIKLCKDSWDAACEVCDCVALEQPKTIMQKYIGKRSQTIHPWQFGHGETKETWLWLKGLPILFSTAIVNGRENRIWKMPPSPDRQKLRSKTYIGIAKAMAEQWTNMKKKTPKKDAVKLWQEMCKHNSGFISNTGEDGSKCIICGKKVYPNNPNMNV